MYRPCVVLLTCLAWVKSQSNSIKEEFTDDTNKGFNHLTVNKLTGTLYVGAVNKIYMLNDQLNKLQDAVTGPELDNPDCFPPSIEDKCDHERKYMDSYNKALVIDYSGNRIIACTSLFQGICEKRKLTDISMKDTQDYTPMVANNATASTVVFIANGPYYPPAKALYIGVTWTKTGPGLVGYRGNVPAFCSRNLTNFNFVYRDISANSKKEILTDNRDTFPVIYVYGFESDGFSYVVTIQKENLTSKKFISKLIRVCQKDKQFYSYVETRLECYHSGTMYNLVQAAYVGKPGKDLAKNLGYDSNTTEDVLYAVFSIGQANSHQPTGTSALCVYPMSAIRNKFTANIQKCFDGNGTYGVEHMETLENCGKSDFGKIENDYCGTFGIYYPIDGSIPNKADAAVQFKNNKTMSAIHVSTVNDYTVAFVGTTSGHLKKVVLETGSIGHEYEDIVIDEGLKINADLHMDTTKDFLYAMTPKKISKILVHDCSRYKTCNECISALDPYCGWCSLESKCSLRSDCAARESELGWVPYNKKQCTSMNLHPDQTQIDENKTPIVTLRVINLPQFSGAYECAFKRGSTMLTTAVIQGPATTSSEPSAPTQLQCSTPAYDLLPKIPDGQDHLTMILSLRMDDQDFVSKNFTFFDCNAHISCSSCTQSDYSCTWCVKNHRCTNRSHDCLNEDTLVTGQNVKGMSHNQGPEKCPKIDVTSGDIMTYIPSETRYNLQVQYFNLQPFQKTNLRCVFIMNPNREVSATIFENTSIIKCGAVLFTYDSKSQFMNVPFEVHWGEGQILDNPKNIQVQMYKCDAIAASCGQCLTMEPKYNCGWCDTFCTVNTQCPNDWLNRESSCPNPQITNFHPMSGPVEGGTKLVITGINLGKAYNDIKDGVFVAGIQCETVEREYVAAEKITCITKAINGANERTGKVIVYIDSGTTRVRYYTTSQEKFHYVIPVITKIEPNIGPIAGGTQVTIFGEHMDAGSTITVTVGDLPCRNIRRRNSSIHCETTESTQTMDRAVVQVNMDKESIRGDQRSHFRYVENPVVLEVTPLMSIRSGGLTLIVKGVNFDTIQEPMIVFWLGNDDFINSCEKVSEKELRCVSPNLASNLDNVNLSRPREVEFGFLMDNVQSLLRYTKAVFQIFQDPMFDIFDDPNRVLSHQKSNEYMIINGDNLLPAINRSDVKVIVGDDVCKIHSIAAKAVTCKPPKNQPTAKNSRYPEVIVTVGRNLTFHIGFMRYQEPEVLPLEYQIVIGVAGGILLLGLVLVICLYKRKSRENRNTMKRMQFQMDTLESKVAKECKEAFAELQTDMTELTSDHEGQVSIPYLDYRDYCIHVLFPGVDDQQLIQALQNEMYYPVHIEDGLRKFSNLLGNKTFLLIFVRTLEGNKHFTMHDRVRVASLINVALQTRMEYSTEVLKTLLAELIEKSVDGDKSSSHPKLLLRRTESVAEKMLTNWFTFLLYKFLKECTGEPLFVLYQAMKQQIAKGPVDALTSEARYSLSESKLIRQQIDYKQMTIYVINMEQCRNQHEHPVKVLDCDSISQVKDKILDSIYKNAPFSSRPPRDTVDLEWHSGRQGKMLLQDEDSTSKTEGDYRRLNTLTHYKIPDCAFMTLVPRQHYNQSIQSNRSGTNRHDNFMSSTRSPSLNRTNSPSPTRGDTEGLKCYHLVKQHDAESHKDGDRGSMMVSEIYLTRLLTAKGTLQPYVDDLFERIFSTAFRGCVLPLAIKYMFDFLDDQAILHQIQDPEVVHTWKSNSLPLRFWVNVIKNPDFVFDISKSNIIDSCLSVMAQTFMDSCSMSEHRLGINSPSSKLLYAKDIPKYKKWVERYYQDIKMMPAISDQDMNAMLAEDSRKHDREFNTKAALHELYKYINRYMDEILQALEEDEFAKKNRLTSKLVEVHQAMSHESEEAYC